MTPTTIFTVDAAGTLTAMRPSAPRSEDFMQELVARHPALIADADGALLLIRREQPIADATDGAGRWSLDHLFVTQTGIPVLVELKRATDTRLRREVVGQILDYAANAAAYWQAGRIADSFAATATELGRDPDAELSAFLRPDADAPAFWQQVDANISAGQMKLVIVADTIPRELARIVEFLNEQMRADVRAVELSWFESEGGITAPTPRVIGETSRAETEKAARSATALPPITREEWIDRHLAPHGAGTVTAAHAFIRAVENAGGRAEVTKAQGSIIAVFEGAQDTLFPMGLNFWGQGMVQLSLKYLKSRPAFAAEAARQDLYDRLATIVGPLSTDSLTGFPAFSVLRLNEPQVAEGLRGFLAHVAAVAEG